MRIFRHWVKVEAVVDCGGRPETIRCFGGSNVSAEAARADALARVARVRARIAGQAPAREGYEADIREELLHRIDDRNLVTRNRYGAAVLNSADLLFVDIDEPRYRFWEVFFGLGPSERRKRRIVEFVRRQAARLPELRGLGIRLYETHRGIRALVTGRNFSPAAPETQRLLRDLNADRLYADLCRKQACFRARLTPKPYRMHCPTHRVVYPRDAAAEAGFRQWLAAYESKAPAYATCRYLETIGPECTDAAIEYHDRMTGAHSGRRLA